MRLRDSYSTSITTSAFKVIVSFLFSVHVLSFRATRGGKGRFCCARRFVVRAFSYFGPFRFHGSYNGFHFRHLVRSQVTLCRRVLVWTATMAVLLF